MQSSINSLNIGNSFLRIYLAYGKTYWPEFWPEYLCVFTSFDFPDSRIYTYWTVSFLMARQWKTIIMLFSDMILFYALRKEKRRKKYLHFAISWNILWRFWYLFQIFCSSELFCKSAWGMSFVFHEELHLKTLKVYNHPIEKCYNSVFQKQAPCKSDKKKVVLFIMLVETKLILA